MGEAADNTIRIDESYVNDPDIIGTIIHEITHTTTVRKLTEDATATVVGRAVHFRRYNPQQSFYTEEGYRADEYEARMRQVAFLKFKGLADKASKKASEMELFRKVETDDCSYAIANIDHSNRRFIEYAGSYGIYEIYFRDLIIRIPIPHRSFIQFTNSTGGNRHAYAKMILEERLRFLNSKSPAQ